MPGRPRTIATAMLIGLAAIAPTIEAEPHRHYAELLRSGTAALEAENWVDAAADLRIAAFGMLDEPLLLAETSIRLAIAQAELDRQEQFVETFQRIADLERRGGSYSEARLSETERARFEHWVASRVPERMLTGSTTFARLVEAKRAADLAAMPIRQRVQRLEGLIESDPANPKWPYMAAQSEIERGRLQDAVDHLSNLLRIETVDSSVRDNAVCLRARTLADGENCTQAVRDFAACSSTTSSPGDAAHYARCLVDTDEAQQAADFLAGLDETVRSHPAVIAAVPELAAGTGAPSDALVLDQATTDPNESANDAENVTDIALATEPKEVTEPLVRGPQANSEMMQRSVSDRPRVDPPVQISGPTPAGPRPLTDTERVQLERARELHRSAKSHAELVEPLRLAREVADARADSVEAQHLAAVIAYRSSQWATAVHYFQRGGLPPAGSPETRFYLAVALYENGQTEQAAQVLSSCIDQLERTAFVERYSRMILETNKP